MGRFISEDPLGFEADDVNFYAYVGNNPINNNDPSGLIDFFVEGFGGGTLGVGGEGSAGVFLNIGDGSGNFSLDAGGFASLEGTVGADLGAGVNIGFVTGGREAINVPTDNINVTLFGVTGTLKFEQGTQTSQGNIFSRLVGGSIGLAPAGIPFGATVSREGTTSNSVGDIFNSIRNGIDQFITDPFTQPGGSGPPILGNLGFTNSPSGGFVLYPNKPNLNTLQAVYSK